MSRKSRRDCSITCEKTGGPWSLANPKAHANNADVLGMELDTNKLVPYSSQTRQPESASQKVGIKNAGRKRDLLSLIGYLQHAAKAVHQGRSFVRLMHLYTTVHL